jgi:hypothetical protein
MLTFVESPIFSRTVYDYLDDDEYGEFQLYLAANPEAGRMVRGSGGVRKARWSRRGAGKSGGVRVIYFARTHRSGCSRSTRRARGTTFRATS